MTMNIGLPPQQLPMGKKTKAWRKKMLDYADTKTIMSDSLVRKSVYGKQIVYDLLDGILHMQDLRLVLNPAGIKADFVPDQIQHYPIINPKLEVLVGECTKRIFDCRVVVTNPNAISDIENKKKQAVLQELQQWIQREYKDEQQAQQELERINDYFSYEWQDMREVRANALLTHYNKEYDIPHILNSGFIDALAVGEEAYQCDIVGGEPVIEKLNTQKMRVLMSGHSNRIEDADMIILEDYWPPGRVIDTYYDVLSKKDIDYIENCAYRAPTDSMDTYDETMGFIDAHMASDVIVRNLFGDAENPFANSAYSDLFAGLPYDLQGNIKVLRVYWKSRRRIKKVKSYDPETGEEVYNFYPETYIVDEAMGEEEEIYYVNEAWEGTKIGNEIYVNMRPRPVQYNRLDNPSRCHFGIIGSIYNLNDDRPFSFVDRMKPYSYLYDVIHDRLNKLIARNWGNLVRLDFSKVPRGWDVDKWLYYAKTMGLAIEDSFKEGNVGAATGKLAGALNNASSGVIAASDGNAIQGYIQLLEYIKEELSEAAGISKQREGQVSNRETVGGVERATLQSSHITEWYFARHDNVKKRVYECFLETAKIALKGRSKKFPYILSDNSMRIMDIDGDEFAECDYGLVVDNGDGTQKLEQQLDTLAQAALQNQKLSFSTIMKLYTSTSLAEKQRLVEKDEQQMQQQQQQAQQQEAEAQQAKLQQDLQMKQAELKQREDANVRDNETRILVANINAESRQDDTPDEVSPDVQAKLDEQKAEFERKMEMEGKWLDLEKRNSSDDLMVRKRQLELEKERIQASKTRK